MRSNQWIALPGIHDIALLRIRDIGLLRGQDSRQQCQGTELAFLRGHVLDLYTQRT